jgi:hypothetical protein
LCARNQKVPAAVPGEIERAQPVRTQVWDSRRRAANGRRHASPRDFGKLLRHRLILGNQRRGKVDYQCAPDVHPPSAPLKHRSPRPTVGAELIATVNRSVLISIATGPILQRSL